MIKDPFLYILYKKNPFLLKSTNFLLFLSKYKTCKPYKPHKKKKTIRGFKWN